MNTPFELWHIVVNIKLLSLSKRGSSLPKSFNNNLIS